MTTRFHVVIPSRYGATRLPGKPLRLIAGKPMIAHVLERGREAGAASVTVATDDERIVKVVEEHGGVAMMTRADHVSGTDRLHEVATAKGWSDDTIVVNLQGDEPGMPGSAARLAASLLEDPRAGIATLATPIRAPQELFDPNTVKVVLDDAGFARYFSRAPIPWVRGAFDVVPAALPEGVPFLRHLGLYAYRVGVLRRLCAAPPAAIERAESLEQLRALALGVAILVGILDSPPSHGVDSEADLARIQDELRGPTDGG
jgi:3-deoxy-manno-octulosonate cytidylyltransferase (CMP-KDO synthetase)